MFVISRLFSRIFILLTLISVSRMTPGACAEPQAHGLPRQFLDILGPRRRPFSSSQQRKDAADLIVCDPYCETVAKIYYADALTYQDGLQVVPPTDIKALNPGKGAVRILPAGAKIYQMLHPDYAPPEPTRLGVESSDAGRGLLGGDAWILEGMLGVFLGKRTLTTIANTDLETDSGRYGIYEMGAGLRLPTAMYFSSFSSVMEIQGLYRGGFLEKPTNASTPRTIKTSTYDFKTNLFLSPKTFGQAPRGAGFFSWNLLAGARLEELQTDPQSPLGFSTTSFLMYMGVGFRKGAFSVALLKSFMDSTQDVEAYRGTSVTSGFTEIDTQVCRPFGSPRTLVMRLCGQGILNWTRQNGVGDPLRTVFTATPEHDYLTWNLGMMIQIETQAFRPSRQVERGN